jgi:DNA modification methylase
MPYYQDNLITIYNKDCRQMSDLSDESVQCVVTSPPYWGLRKYAGKLVYSIWDKNVVEVSLSSHGLVGVDIVGGVDISEEK